MRKTLISYGLSDKEVEVYLESLKLGESTANKIATKTDLARSTIYDILESLKNKGLINQFKKDKKLFFAASDPNTLITKLKEKEQLINEILPDLKELQEYHQDPSIITIYKGTTGLRTAANEMLNSKEILVYGGSIKADSIFGTYTSNFAQRRAEKKIILKTIIGTTIPEHMQVSNVKKYTPIKTLSLFGVSLNQFPLLVPCATVNSSSSPLI